ncbi:MAG: hypothetical protein WC798_01455 [Candidatus Paceibacterota bacterium]|jgi:hypothetical protein
MIYLFYGTDLEKTRAKAFAWVAAARKKEPNLAYVRLAREELIGAALEDAALSGGLFVKRLLILIDDPFSSVMDTECPSNAFLEDHLDALTASDNAILILAPGLAAAKAKKIATKAKVAYEFNKTAAREAVRGFNSNLVNALAARNSEKLWLEINKALRLGDAPEMLHGLLHWKARDLMEKGSRSWSPQESRQLSLALISLLQTSRRGGLDLSLSLEHFALSI